MLKQLAQVRRQLVELTARSYSSAASQLEEGFSESCLVEMESETT